jgi:hypothetical protein
MLFGQILLSFANHTKRRGGFTTLITPNLAYAAIRWCIDPEQPIIRVLFHLDGHILGLDNLFTSNDAKE